MIKSLCLGLTAVGAVLLCGCAGSSPDPLKARTPYVYPLNSPGGKFAGLPPAVQNTVRAQAGSEVIYDIHKDATSDPVVYEITFENKLLPPLLIASDGSVLNPDLTVAVGAAKENIGTLSGGAASGLKPSDLPPNVMKVAQERAPNTEIAFIHKEVSNDREVYSISFKDPARNPSLRIASDGTVLNEVVK
jgi:hypothetical protein